MAQDLYTQYIQLPTYPGPSEYTAEYKNERYKLPAYLGTLEYDSGFRDIGAQSPVYPERSEYGSKYGRHGAVCNNCNNVHKPLGLSTDYLTHYKGVYAGGPLRRTWNGLPKAKATSKYTHGKRSMQMTILDRGTQKI